MAGKLRSTNTGTTSTTTIGGPGSTSGIMGYTDAPGSTATSSKEDEDRKFMRVDEREKSDDLSGDENLKPRRSQAKRQWSIQAVKGKVTTRCLWNACKALTFGIVLIFVGAGMSAAGYYADEAEYQRSLLNQTETDSETISVIRPPLLQSSIINKTVTNVKPQHTQSKKSSFVLRKLAYVGPIVMGVGGFVIVAACVMTFEARDSAAKIVPARFRKAIPDRTVEDSGVRHSAVQTKWHTLGVYGAELLRFHHERELSRRAMTSAFIRFSKNLQSSIESSAEYYDVNFGGNRNLVKCPSAPSLVREFQQDERRNVEAPRILRVSAFPKPPPRRRLSSNVYPRQTMSMDNPAVREVYAAAYPALIGEKGDEDMELGASATGVHRTGSDASLALDLHFPQCAVTLAVRDSSRSPSTQADSDEQILGATAGPSGLGPLQISPTYGRPKVDKQTSTSDHLHIGMLGWSGETAGSRDAHMSSRATAGGSFREPKRSKAGRKVKRSETIDTTTSAHRKHNDKTPNSRSRTNSVRSGSSRTTSDPKRMAPSRSETARRHQLLRQQKIETPEIHDPERGPQQV